MRSKIYETVRTRLKVDTSTVRKWIADYEAYKVVLDSKRGKHGKWSSPIMDEDFRYMFKTYVKENSKKQGKYITLIQEFYGTCKNLAKVSLSIYYLMVIFFWFLF